MIKTLEVWGSDCVSCGNATASSQRCDVCGSTEFTMPLYYDAAAFNAQQERIESRAVR